MIWVSVKVDCCGQFYYTFISRRTGPWLLIYDNRLNSQTLWVIVFVSSVRAAWQTCWENLAFVSGGRDRQLLWPQGAVPQGFYLLRQGQVYRLAPEAPPFLGECLRGLKHSWNWPRIWALVRARLPTLKRPSATFQLLKNSATTSNPDILFYWYNLDPGIQQSDSFFI